MSDSGLVGEVAIFRKLQDAARKSPDPSTQTAALVYCAEGSYAFGINEFPEGVVPRLRRPAKYLFIEHAERDAILTCAREGYPTDGGIMYTLWAICHDCARAVVNSGIKEVVAHSFYQTSPQWTDSIQAGFTILEEGGVNLRFVDFPVDPDGPGLLYNGEIVRF